MCPDQRSNLQPWPVIKSTSGTGRKEYGKDGSQQGTSAISVIFQLGIYFYINFANMRDWLLWDFEHNKATQWRLN